jgi:hypothetical protein
MGAMRHLALTVLPLLVVAAACSSSSGGHGTPADGGVTDGTTDTGASDTAAGDHSSGDTGSGCPASTNTVSGTVSGVTLTPMSAAAFLGLADASYPNQATIVIANVPDICAVIRSLFAHPSQLAANLDQLLFTLGETSATAGPVTVGTYTPTSTPDELTAQFESFDATCQPTGDAGVGGVEQTSGQVVLCTAGPTYSGTFDLIFGADHITGTFSAPLCEVAADAGAPPLGDGGACQ